MGRNRVFKNLPTANLRRLHKSHADDDDEDCSNPPCRALMRCEKHAACKESLRKVSELLQKALDDASFYLGRDGQGEIVGGGAPAELETRMRLSEMYKNQLCIAARIARKSLRRRGLSPDCGSASMSEVVDRLQERVTFNLSLLQRRLRDKQVELSMSSCVGPEN